MIARWYSKQPLTNHMQCFAIQRILEIIARKLVLIPLTICWDQEFGATARRYPWQSDERELPLRTTAKLRGFQWKTTYWPKNSCRVCHEKLFYVTCMITTDDNLTENFTIPDIIETSSNHKLFKRDHKRQTAVCGQWFHDICLPIFRKQDSRVVACGCHVCFYSFVHFYFS